MFFLTNYRIIEFIFGLNVRYCFKVGQYSVKFTEKHDIRPFIFVNLTKYYEERS